LVPKSVTLNDLKQRNDRAVMRWASWKEQILVNPYLYSPDGDIKTLHVFHLFKYTGTYIWGPTDEHE